MSLMSKKKRKLITTGPIVDRIFVLVTGGEGP